jgi:hypothetical protein
MSSFSNYDWQDVYVACEKAKLEIGRLLAEAKNDTDMLHGNLFTFDHYDSFLNMVFIVPHKADRLVEGQMAIPLASWLKLDASGEDGAEQVRQFLVEQGLKGIRVSLLNQHTTGQKKILSSHLQHRVEKIREGLETLSEEKNNNVIFN